MDILHVSDRVDEEQYTRFLHGFNENKICGFAAILKDKGVF